MDPEPSNDPYPIFTKTRKQKVTKAMIFMWIQVNIIVVHNKNESLIHYNALRHIQDKCFAELLPLHFACLPWFAQKFICWNVCFELLTFITNRFFCLLHSLSWWVPPTNCLVYAIPVGPKRVQYHPLNLLKQCQLMELLMENRLLIKAQKPVLPTKQQLGR